MTCNSMRRTRRLPQQESMKRERMIKVRKTGKHAGRPSSQLTVLFGAMLGGLAVLHGAGAAAQERVEVLPLRGSLYLIVADGNNLVASIGADGVLLADTGPESMVEQVSATVRNIQQEVNAARPALLVGGSETRSNTRAMFDPPPQRNLGRIRYILNTSGRPEHNGGNAAMAVVPQELSSQNPNEKATKIHAHENVLLRVSGALGDEHVAPYEFWPSDVYYESFYKLPHFNGEAIQLIHAPAASTDGDSFVWFRGSDVISTGDVYRTDRYPEPDPELGGDIQGIIDGLNMLVDLGAAEYRAEGGTLFIPGHGRVSDVSDVAGYRDMVTIIRDRVQSMIDKQMTLAEIKAAKPSFDYDQRYARQPGVADRFIESIYSGLTRN